MSGRYIRFRAKKIQKLNICPENAGVFLPLSRKSLDVETKQRHEFRDKYLCFTFHERLKLGLILLAIVTKILLEHLFFTNI